MTTTSATQSELFLHAARTQLAPPSEWTRLNTYPHSLAEAIIDAIWSERVRYTNVVEIVDRYRDFRSAEGADADYDGARELAASFSGGVDAWIDRIGNRQRVFSRDDAPFKAEVVYQGAEAAIAAGVETVQDLKHGYATNNAQFRDLHQRWLGLPSQRSGLSWERLQLAAGIETVPLDPWLVEFASHAVGAPVGGPQALGLIDEAAQIMGVGPFRLRNAIWQYQTKLDQREHHSPTGSNRQAPGAAANEPL